MKVFRLWWEFTTSLAGLVFWTLVIGIVIGLVLGVRMGLAWDGDLAAFEAVRR
jgi:ABC-type proline/glycine betaine transport system permease subunit